MQKSVLVQFEGPSFEALLFDIVDRAIKRNQATTTPSQTDTEPFGDFHWLRGACSGIPASTLRIKSAAGEIPGTKKIGKRVLYDKAEVLNWIRSQTQTQKADADTLEEAAEAQINGQLAKQRKANRQQLKPYAGA